MTYNLTNANQLAQFKSRVAALESRGASVVQPNSSDLSVILPYQDQGRILMCRA